MIPLSITYPVRAMSLAFLQSSYDLYAMYSAVAMKIACLLIQSMYDYYRVIGRCMCASRTLVTRREVCSNVSICSVRCNGANNSYANRFRVRARPLNGEHPYPSAGLEFEHSRAAKLALAPASVFILIMVLPRTERG